ncbi:hypothetical protein PS2015_1954 [Pseudohongiella spirulinae]|uniref:Uncharacterized protein n=2 Tax=Pseudohongiella spirulinae TaxID=1249552 RepID=A0A0S2KEW9_9GAMM|nr:hypothetical protein PS2015_1954 [Pseudohongiella spirulinae]
MKACKICKIPTANDSGVCVGCAKLLAADDNALGSEYTEDCQSCGHKKYAGMPCYKCNDGSEGASQSDDLTEITSDSTLGMFSTIFFVLTLVVTALIAIPIFSAGVANLQTLVLPAAVLLNGLLASVILRGFSDVVRLLKNIARHK